MDQFMDMGEETNSNRKVVLFIPNTRWYGKRPWLMIPYAALILTALLKKSFNFSILDANIDDMSQDECISALQNIDPEIVLISTLSVEYHQQYHTAIDLAKRACPSCITIVGGIYPTVLGRELIMDANIDYIFIGHAEERIAEFISLVFSNNKNQIESFNGIGFRDGEGKPIINDLNTYISNVKKMVQPDYSLINTKKYLYTSQQSNHYQLNSNGASSVIITSYGCPYNCVFCATRTISGRKIAFRTVEDIIDEMEFLMYEHGVSNFNFLDDCLLADRQRIYKLLNIIIERAYKISWKVGTVSAWHLNDELMELMKKAGCTQFTISVESGNPRVLHKIIRKPLKLEIVPGIVKKCNELGIDIGANFIIGFPGETWDEIRETFRFAESCNFDLVHFHIATPLPKTDLYRIAKEQNLLPSNFSFADPKYFGFGQAFIKTDEFTPFELMVLRAFEWDRINFNTPEKIAKAAKMMNLTIEELNNHRRQTRQNCGIHF